MALKKPGFLPGIQMDADPNQHRPEGEMTITPDFQAKKMVVVQDSVIYPFTGCSLRVNVFELFAVPWDGRKVTEICICLKVQSTAVFAGGACFLTFEGINSATGEGATVFLSLFLAVIAPGTHLMPFHAMRVAVFVDRNILRDTVAGFIPGIDVNEGVDPPSLQELIGGDVVVGGIKANV